MFCYLTKEVSSQRGGTEVVQYIYVESFIVVHVCFLFFFSIFFGTKPVAIYSKTEELRSVLDQRN